MSLALALRHRVPVELQAPVEAADVHAARVAPVVLQRRVVDHIDHRADDRRPVARDAIEQRLQPACGYLDTQVVKLDLALVFISRFVMK